MLKVLRKIKLGRSDFLRNVLTLMTGTTLAQSIPIAAMPLLTRLYSPEDFGVLALYLSLSGIIAVVVTGRYEVAVMLPEKDEDAASLVILSLCIAAVIGLILFLVVFLFNEDIQSFLNNEDIGVWLYLMPLTVFIVGGWQALNYWNNRAKNFKRLAYSRVTQGGGMTLAQFLLSAMGAGGLVLGHLIGQVGGVLVFLARTWREDRGVLSKVTWARVMANAKGYSKFPKYSTVGALLNNLGTQMPVLMLSKFRDGHTVGVFSLTFRALNLPMSLIATSFAQVLFQRFVALERECPERLAPFVLKLFFGLLVLTIPLVAVIWLFGPELFAFIFGEEWRSAGEFAKVIVLAVAIRFAVSPLSTVLAMDHNVKIGTLWQVIYFGTVTCVLLIFKNSAIENFLLALALHDVTLYCLYLGFIVYGAKRRGAAKMSI